MDNYYDVLRGYLTHGAYLIDDATSRIDYGVAAGKLTPDQAEELLSLAQIHSGYKDTDGKLDAIIVRLSIAETQIAQMAARVAQIESGESTGGGDEPGDDEPAETILDWKMPTGAHDAPNIGDKRRYNGQVWVSNINGNTTVPGSDPRWWTLIG